MPGGPSSPGLAVIASPRGGEQPLDPSEEIEEESGDVEIIGATEE